MYFLDRRRPRPVTDALRATVLEDLPELAQIRSDELRRKAIEAWAYALAETDFPRVAAIPGEATPGVFALKRGSQTAHLRSVARIAIAIADEFAQEFPEARVDRDIVLAGALLLAPTLLAQATPKSTAGRDTGRVRVDTAAILASAR